MASSQEKAIELVNDWNRRVWMGKYKKGPAFVSIAELADWLESGKAVYFREKYLSLEFGYVDAIQEPLMDSVKYRVVYRVLEV